MYTVNFYVQIYYQTMILEKELVPCWEAEGNNNIYMTMFFNPQNVQLEEREDRKLLHFQDVYFSWNKN